MAVSFREGLYTILPGGTSPTRDTLVLSTLLGELNLAVERGTVEMMEALVTDARHKKSGCEGRNFLHVFFEMNISVVK